MSLYDIKGLLLKQGTEIAGIHISVLTCEQHNFTSSVTNIPLENGVVIRDHVIVNPDKLTVNFECSNTDSQSAQDTFEQFKQLRDNRELLEIITEHKIYKNLVLTEFSATHCAPYKGALQGTLVFEEVALVTVTAVGREPKKIKKTRSTKSMSKKVDIGNVEPEQPTSTFLGNIAKSFL